MDEVAAVPGRSRCRRRVRWAVAGAVVVGVALLGRWWLDPLRGLPDVGDPFDRAEVAGLHVPGAENAFGPYSTAVRLLSATPKTYPSGDEGLLDWDDYDEATRGWLASNPQALEYWLAGADRPDALYIPADQVAIDTLLPVTQGLSELARLGGRRGGPSRARGRPGGGLGDRAGDPPVRGPLRPERGPDRAARRRRDRPVRRPSGSSAGRPIRGSTRRCSAGPWPTSRRPRRCGLPSRRSCEREYLLLMNALDDPRLRDAPAQYIGMLRSSPTPLPMLTIGPLTLTADQFQLRRPGADVER